jgi:hypothetical protein
LHGRNQQRIIRLLQAHVAVTEDVVARACDINYPTLRRLSVIARIIATSDRDAPLTSITPYTNAQIGAM